MKTGINFKMFNTYHRYGGPSKIEVTEKRATTDDSIRLAGEYREKTLKSVLAKGIDPLGTEATWTIMKDLSRAGVSIYFKMKLNAKTLDFQVFIDEIMLSNDTYEGRNELLKHIRDGISEEIASELTMIVLEDTIKNGFDWNR